MEYIHASDIKYWEHEIKTLVNDYKATRKERAEESICKEIKVLIDEIAELKSKGKT
jgi:hypothetical protein